MSKLEAVAGIHGMTKTILNIVNKKDLILIISKDGNETDNIMQSIMRRLNHQTIPYEANIPDKVILADNTLINIYSELQIPRIPVKDYDMIYYNPMIPHDALDNLNTRFGGK